MPAYLKQAPVGVPGDISRTDNARVEPAMLVALSSVFAAAYGIAMKYVAGGIQQFASGDSAAQFAGFLARGVPSIGTSDTTFAGGPLSTQVQNLLVEGYMSVVCKTATPVRGQPVYICINVTGGNAIGDLCTTADSGNNIALPGVSWASDGKDASNNAEIRISPLK
jgi:hypothetical protein